MTIFVIAVAASLTVGGICVSTLMNCLDTIGRKGPSDDMAASVFTATMAGCIGFILIGAAIGAILTVTLF